MLCSKRLIDGHILNLFTTGAVSACSSKLFRGDDWGTEPACFKRDNNICFWAGLLSCVWSGGDTRLLGLIDD